MLYSPLVLALVMGTTTLAQIVSLLNGSDATLTIANKRIAPDGFERPAVLAGGKFPGPLIKAFPTTQFNINVLNKLTNNAMNLTTSVHWHGLMQQKTTYYDGASMVTQCPIVPNESFMYDFSANGQAGTYWYHSHQAAQYCDGLRGPLVIYDPNDPHKAAYDVDDETTVITLADWYHTVSPLQSQPAYRLRIVSMSCDPNYMFSIDQHNMTVIEADGVNTQMLTVDKIQVFAAQRYSVILNANQNIDNYWIRALPNNPANTNFTGNSSMAILRYVGASASHPETSDKSKTTLKEQDIKPLNSAPVPGGHSLNASDVHQVNLVFSVTGASFFVNGTSYTPPATPVLAQILATGTPQPQVLPKGSVIPLPKNTTVQISMQLSGDIALASGPHPLHLHGHNFHVVQATGQAGPNFVDPPVRDVVSVGPGSPVVIRFRTDNPGPWFFHCHIDWHLLHGFAVVFAEDSPDIPTIDQPPQEWTELCPAYNTYKKNGGHT